MIYGEKTILCGITKQSSAKILSWANKPELRKLNGTIYPISEYEHDQWLNNKMTNPNEKLFLVCDKQTMEEIGTIGFKNTNWISRNAELYISLGNEKYTEACGKGYGTDAVNTLCNFCFDSLGLHKIYLYVFESNARAIRCYEKAGFSVEGRLKEHHFFNGSFEDVLVMGKICK